jgi:hypothetical protein
LFDPHKAPDPFDEKFDRQQLKSEKAIDNPENMKPESKKQEKCRLEEREKQDETINRGS